VNLEKHVNLDRAFFLPRCSPGPSGVGALIFSAPPPSEEISDSGPLSLWQSNAGSPPGLVNLVEELRPCSSIGEGFVQVMAVALPWGLRLLCIVNPLGSQSGSRDAIVTGSVYPISLITCLMIMPMSSLAEWPGMKLHDNGCPVSTTAQAGNS